MSYATVAGLPPRYGLYNAFIALISYPFFGTSPHLMTGPAAVMSILVNELVPKHPMGDPTLDTGPTACLTDPDSPGCQVRVAMMMTLSLLAGLLQIFMGFLRLGFLVDLISEPVVTGFTTGSAFLIASTQINSFLSIKNCNDTDEGCLTGLTFLDTVINVFLQTSRVHWETVAFGVAAIGILWVFQSQMGNLMERAQVRRMFVNICSRLGPLTLMLISIPVMFFTDANPAAGKTENNWGIAVVGSVCKVHNAFFHPECLPPFHWAPTMASGIMQLGLKEILPMLGAATAVGLIGYVESISIAKTMARQKTEESGEQITIDPTNEMMAIGFSNSLCSFFSGYPVTGSFSRSAVNLSSGSRSPLAAAVAAAIAGITLMFLTPVLQFIPKVALAAIVLTAVVKLIHINEGFVLWHVSKRDLVAFLVVCTSTMLLGVESALVLGILTSWILTLTRTRTTTVCIVGRLPSGHVVDVVKQGLQDGDALSLQHVVVLRFRDDLSFTTADRFKCLISQISRAVHPAAVVVDCSSVNIIDATGVMALRAATLSLQMQGLQLRLATLSPDVHQVLARTYKCSKDLQEGPLRWDIQIKVATDLLTPEFQSFPENVDAVPPGECELLERCYLLEFFQAHLSCFSYTTYFQLLS